MKPILNYLSPFLGLGVLAFSNYAFYIFNSGSLQLQNYILLLVYEILVVMVVISLLTAFFKDPGYIPIQYTYNQENLSQTVASLLKFDKQSDKQYQVLIPAQNRSLPKSVLDRFVNQDPFQVAETEYEDSHDQSFQPLERPVSQSLNQNSSKNTLSKQSLKQGSSQQSKFSMQSR